jgi:septum formation protein
MIHKLLNGKKLVLASASPRRSELFKLLGLKPLIIPSLVMEPITDDATYLQVMRHAENKALSVSRNMDSKTVVVGADTLVVIESKVLGKPESREQAAEFLRILSGKSHYVYSGIAVVYKAHCYKSYARSRVEFSVITDEDIQQYLDTGEPMDKAGAYGIQGYGAQFIEKIHGCYFNVMGFPINLFYKLLNEIISSDT